LGTFHVFGVPGRTHAAPVISVAVAAEVVAEVVAAAAEEVVVVVEEVEVVEVVVEEVADPAVSAGAS
jgi:hypothetical protein